MSPIIDLTPIAGAALAAVESDHSFAGVASLAAMMLAAVFAAAALTKLMAPAETAKEFAELGLPTPALLARLVPIAELGIAVALIIHPPLGATSAAMMLCSFTAVLMATLRSGRTVTCGCLGALSRRPVTAATVARNLVLLATTGAAAAVRSLSVPNLPAVMTVALLAAIAAVGLQLLATKADIGRIWSVELAGEIDLTDEAHTKGIAA